MEFLLRSTSDRIRGHSKTYQNLLDFDLRWLEVPLRKLAWEQGTNDLRRFDRVVGLVWRS